MSLNLSLTWEGHTCRVVGSPERPEWIAADICAALELRASNPWKHLPSTEKGKHNELTPGGWQQMVTVTEPGLYRLIFMSRRPEAAEFRTWIVRFVLPSIRKWGSYPPPPDHQTLPPGLDLRDARTLAPLALQLAQIVQEQQATIAALEPKAESHDRLTAAQGAVSLMTAARILGRQPLLWIEDLESAGILFRGEHDKLLPNYYWRERGYFVVREHPVDGHAYIQTMVTPSGLQWLATLYPATDRQAQTQTQPLLTH